MLVFTDVPHESVNISLIADTQGYFSISVSGGPGDFLVVASGLARRKQAYAGPNGQDDFVPGVLINSVSGQYGIGVWKNWGFQAASMNGLPVSSGIDGYVYNGDVTVAAGNQYTGTFRALEKPQVFGKFKNPIISKSGAIELGRLPLIGAALVTMETVGPRKISSQGPMGVMTISGRLSSLSDTIPFSEMSNATRPIETKWYTPDAHVRISIVSSRKSVNDLDPSIVPPAFLPPNYRLESAAPPTEDLSELLWESENNAQVTWDLTDLSAAQTASTWLFFSGIFIAAALSFLGMAVDRAFH